MKKRIKIQGFLIFTAIVIVVVFYKYLLPGPANNITEITFNIIGAALFLLGYFLRVVARGYKAELNPDGKILVTKGPYAITRNPMYLGTLLIGLGVILLILSWWLAAPFLAIYLLIYMPQIKKEEKKLRDFFQGAFINYCKDTPKFFPTIKSLMHPDSRIKLKLIWAKKEFPSLAASFLFVAGVKIWELLRQ